MKKITLMTLVLGLTLNLGMTKPAEAITLIDWDIDFIGRTLDDSRAGLGGFDNWAKWTYTVTANVDNSTEPGEFTHLGIGMTNDFLDLAGVLGSVSIMDASSTDVTSSYSFEFKSGGGPLTGMGQRLEWNNLANLVVDADDFNTFMFSTPYADVSDVELGIKQQSLREYGTISGPGALADFIPPTGLPEPGTLFLLAIGLAGITWVRRRKMS